mmetsp:Transcript_6183/g.14778  ORF Transcript_6183/g.14778 Transcript_6183/m.14778 type:complete len:324 (+) Transcript_6183:36-1007(+)
MFYSNNWASNPPLIASPDTIAVTPSSGLKLPIRAPFSVAELHSNPTTLAINIGGIQPSLGHCDSALRQTMEPFCKSDLRHLVDLLLDTLATVAPIAPEDRRSPGMRQDVYVTTDNLVVVSERATNYLQMVCIMVLHECARSYWVHAHDATRFASPIQSAEVIGSDTVLQCVVHREVKHSDRALRGIDVVAKDLWVSVPVLRHREWRSSRSNILLLEARREADDEVKPQSAEAHFLKDPVDPLLDILLDLRVGVINVWSVLQELSGTVRSFTHTGVIVSADGPSAPVRLLEHSVLASAILLGGTSVINDCIHHGSNASLAESGA